MKLLITGSRSLANNPKVEKYIRGLGLWAKMSNHTIIVGEPPGVTPWRLSLATSWVWL